MDKGKGKTPDLIDFEEPRPELIFELRKIMLEHKVWPQKIFVVGKKNYLLVYQNITSQGMHQNDFGAINPNHLKRGDILDSFSKIELIVNEIIEAKILGEGGKKQEFSDITIQIDLFQKVNLLKTWGLICQETLDIMNKIRKVRNVLAHSWHIKNVIYEKDKTLETNFPKFQSDIKMIWKRLINVYDYVRPQNKELEKVLVQIKGMIKENE